MSQHGDAPRTVARRRSLPSGRAVAGGFLIALAALGAFVAARGTDTGPDHSYVVVAHDVVAGSTLRAADLRTEPVDLPDVIARRAFTDPHVVVGRVLTTSLTEGELVQASTVIGGDAADPRFQLSLPVERARALDGQLAVGERVDLLVTYGTGSDSATYVVVRGAEVLRVDQRSSGSLNAGSELVLLLALASPDDALAVTHAAQAGDITIVRGTAAATVRGADSYRPPSAETG